MNQCDSADEVPDFVTLKMADHMPLCFSAQLCLLGMQFLDIVLSEGELSCFFQYFNIMNRFGLGDCNQLYFRRVSACSQAGIRDSLLN